MIKVLFPIISCTFRTICLKQFENSLLFLLLISKIQCKFDIMLLLNGVNHHLRYFILSDILPLIKRIKIVNNAPGKTSQVMPNAIILGTF